MGNSKGQNLIEYVLFVTAVVIVCIYFFANHSGGPMATAINASLNGMVNDINNLNSQINLSN